MLLVVVALLLAVFRSVHPVIVWMLMAALATVSLLYYQSLPKVEEDRYARSDETFRHSQPRTERPRSRDRLASALRELVPVFSPERKIQIISLIVFLLVIVILLGIMLLVALRQGWKTPTTGRDENLRTLTANPEGPGALTELGNNYFDQQL